MKVEKQISYAEYENGNKNNLVNLKEKQALFRQDARSIPKRLRRLLKFLCSGRKRNQASIRKRKSYLSRGFLRLKALPNNEVQHVKYIGLTASYKSQR